MSVGIYVFATKGLRSNPRKILLAFVVAIYAISFAHLVIEARYVTRFVLLQIGELEATTVTAQSSVPLALILANVVLSDAIVLWRMCVFCGQQVGSRAAAAVLLAATVVLSALDLVHGSPGDSDHAERTTAVLGDFAYEFAVPALSLFTNLITTLAVGWKTWQHRRDVSRHLQALSCRSAVEKVMVLLVESGSIYCIAWVRSRSGARADT